MDSLDPLELLVIARSIAREAGAMAAHMRKQGISVASTKSNQLDIVTQADTAVETLVRDRLNQLRPEDGFFGEESGEAGGSSGIVWVVDPIDGTVNYLYGSPDWAVSIAATAPGPGGTRISVAGCVYAPTSNREYAAAAGHEATLDGIAIHANAEVPLERALLSTGFMYAIESRGRVLEDIATLTPRIRDWRMGGSAALAICAVADGTTDGYFMRGLPLWDYAAATLIAAQAGADVRGLQGGAAASPKLALATPELLHAFFPLLAD